MLDLVLTPAAFLHAAALIGLIFWACRKRKLPWNDMPFFVALVLWATLVLAAHFTGAFNALNQLDVYVPMSFVALGIMLALVSFLWRIPVATPLLVKPALPFATIEHEKTRRILFWFLIVTLALFALISLVLGQGVYPDNADSMIYRLPRAIWYVSHGNLLHPFDAPDNRILYYPLDGVALYIPLVLYNLPGTWHAMPSLLAWLMIVYTTYRFGRALGGDRLLALLAAWLVGMTPSILAQATSTNDEILTAAVLLCSLYMGWRWLVTGRHAYFFMAGLALGLSAGTKLHIVFLMPIVALVGLVALWPLRQAPVRLRLWGKAIGWKTALLTALIVIVMFAPFLFYNYASVERFYFFDDFKKDVFNLSANLTIGLQNLLIYLSQMMLSPIADMNMWPIANDRQGFNSALNALVNPLIKPLLSQDPTHYHLNYRFVGVTIPVSVRFVEFSLWSAFVWLLWPWQGILALRQRFPLRPLFFLLAMTPPLWLLLWSFSTLYMEGTATYFTFYLVCAAPAAIMVFSPIKKTVWHELRWVMVFLVVFSNLIIDHNLVMYSGFRALPDLFFAQKIPYDWLLAEDRIIDEIRAADRIRVVMTHEKMPYFGYMHWNPKATYYSPFSIKDPAAIPNYQDVLQILPISGLSMYGYMPVKIPGKRTVGPTYLGAVRAIGREAVFAVGHGIEKKYPEESNYLILQARIEQKDKDAWEIVMDPNPMGFSLDDQLTFAYEIKNDGTVLARHDPVKNPSFKITLPFSPYEMNLNLTIIVASAWSGKELTRVTYPLGGKGSWLPEGGEY
ncbi:MAG: phospholipid carrier-dependent glycosyltransferase [Bdellovibrionales bacterium]|jgi:hypothetical protein